MSRTYRFVELVGTSAQGFEDAIQNGVVEARKDYNVRWFEVVQQRGYVSDDGIAFYQAHLKIGYSD